MATSIRSNLRQVVDWGAAVSAGAISGAAFLVVNILLSAWVLQSPWFYVRLLASVVMGESVLPPPTTFEWPIFLVALVVHFFMSIVFACLIAISIYRWGVIVGLIGGALLGLTLYIINFYGASILFPWFFPLRSWMMLASHVVFGALAGSLYEILEVEKFVPEPA